MRIVRLEIVISPMGWLCSIVGEPEIAEQWGILFYQIVGLSMFFSTNLTFLRSRAFVCWFSKEINSAGYLAGG
jgi:hypothetical protein